MKVGFIGVGIMGAGMARNILKAGHELFVHDNRREACDPLVEAGALYADTPSEAAKRSEAIVICVPWPGPQEAVMEGPDGIFAGIESGSLIIDTTVMPPKNNWDLAERCTGLGLDYIDAPVSGAVTGAADGTLGAMVGGDEATFQRALPVLECYASKIRHVGPVGSGNTLKLVNNCIYVSYQSAFAEGLALGKDLGLSLETMLEVLATSSGGQSHITRRYAGIRGDKSQIQYAGLRHRVRNLA